MENEPGESELDDLEPSPPWSSQTKLAVGAGLVVGAALVVWVSRGTLPLVALAALIAFLVAPGVRWLHSRARFPRWLALVVAYLVAFAVGIGIMFILAAGITASIASIDWGGAYDNMREWANETVDWMDRLVVFGTRIDLTELTTPVRDWLESSDTGNGDPGTITITLRQVEAILGGVFQGFRTVAGLIAAIVMSSLVTLMVAVYLNADSGKLHAWIFRTIPDDLQSDAVHVADRFSRIWRGYIYGQLVNSLITGILVGIVLWAVGLPGWFLMAVIMALFNMIPTFGPIIAAIPGVLAALVAGSTKLDLPNIVFALIVAGIYVVVVQAQANLIAPKVMGRAVRLSPVVVLVSLMVGFAVAGLLGSLLAVPVVASGKEVVSYLYNKLVDRDPFPPEPEPEEVVTDAEPEDEPPDEGSTDEAREA